MRSLQPDPTNPWPHDMVLTINNDDQALLELLWVRHALVLRPTGDVPPLALQTPEIAPISTEVRNDAQELEQIWTELWSAVLAHAGKRRNPELFESLQATPPGSHERLELLNEVLGPSWRDHFGDDLFDERYEHWVRQIREQTHRDGRRPLAQHPERRGLAALIPAWRRGLEIVVVVPCAGAYTRTVGPNGLCVTPDTRNDPDLYREALESFGR